MRKLVLLFALLLSSCTAPMGLGATPTPTCEAQAVVYAGQVQAVAREWDDAYKLASTTPRAALAAQIEKLQAIRRKVQDISAPPCASSAHLALTNAMDKSIEAFLAFLGQRPESEVSALFGQANNFMAAYSEAIVRLSIPPATAVP